MAQTKSPVVVEVPQAHIGTSSLSGAQNGTLLLGATLAGVAIWSDTLHPLLDTAWSGQPLAVTLPPRGILALVLFVLGLVFLGTLSADLANLTFWFILGLWVVYLVQHPELVAGVASAFGSNAGAGTTSAPPPEPLPPLPPSSPPPVPSSTPGQTGPR